MSIQIPENQEVLYRLPDVEVISGQKRSTIYERINAGQFPAPVRLGRQSVAWRKSDLDRWLAERKRA